MADTQELGIAALSELALNLTIVMVHGAWADGSSWSSVIRPLQAKGFTVIAAPIPLTSLSDDVKALDRVLDRTSGPVVLASHAYAGAVISATANVRVKSLVYIAGLTPAEGETVAEVFYREKPHALAPQLTPDASGIIWMPAEGFGLAFAPKASPEQIALLSATQRPIAVACIQERSPKPAWIDKPSWYLIAEEDRMIPLATQRYLAHRVKAHVRSEKLDHTPLVTAPDTVVEVILDAVSEAKR
jgi:pimeloyl-ACP methyl ester carboxylesterase